MNPFESEDIDDDLDDVDPDLIDDSFGARDFLNQPKPPTLVSTDRLKQISQKVAAIRAVETGRPLSQAAPYLQRDDEGDSDDDNDDGGIRAFTITAGRTIARSDVMFETVVAPTSQRYTGHGGVASTLLALVATEPLSVAELAVHLEIPIGVSRVLVSDLLDSGHLTSAALSAPIGSVPTSKVDLLKRVISRVEAL
jgi:Protein of unknown function (DUF742)